MTKYIRDSSDRILTQSPHTGKQCVVIFGECWRDLARGLLRINRGRSKIYVGAVVGIDEEGVGGAG